jgi:hypothetical protein
MFVLKNQPLNVFLIEDFSTIYEQTKANSYRLYSIKNLNPEKLIDPLAKFR